MSSSEKALPLHIKWNEDKTQVTGFIGEEGIIQLKLSEGMWSVNFEFFTSRNVKNISVIDGVTIRTPKAIFLVSAIKSQTIAAANAVCPIGISQEEMTE